MSDIEVANKRLQKMTEEKDESKPPWYMVAFEKYGLPTAFLAVVVYMLWTAGAWAGSSVIVPLFDRQIKFMDETSKMVQEQTRTSGLMNQTLEAHGQHAIESLKTCHEIKGVGLETNGNVKSMQASHDQILNVLKSIDENTKPLRSGTHDP